VVAITAGQSHSLALKSDGTVVGWGNNGSGQATPPTNLTAVVAITAGQTHSLALRSDGTVVGWGVGKSGQSTPPTNLAGVVAIAAGDVHSVALKSDGTIVGWGDNRYGEATPLPGLAGVEVLAAGGNYDLVLTCAPYAPSNLVATAVAANQINLNWQDDSGNESGFNVQRAGATNGLWVAIGSVNSNITLYPDMTVSCGQTYYYRVQSYNAATGSPYSNITGANTSLVDTDGDGIPDCWMIQYFGHLTGQSNDNSRAADDADGDGLSNLQEYLAGTDPTNGASSFRIISVVPSGIDLLVTWTMGSGKTNALQTTAGDARGGYSTNGFTNIFIVTNTVGSTTNYLDFGAATNAPVRYYRVRLVP